MRWALPFGLALAMFAVVSGAEPAAETVAPEVKRLAGTWKVVSAVRAGKSEAGMVGLHLRFTTTLVSKEDKAQGHVLEVERPDGERDAAAYILEPATSHKHIDIWSPDYRFFKPLAFPKLQRGLYRLENEELVLCLGKVNGERPETIDPTAAEHLILRLQRNP